MIECFHHITRSHQDSQFQLLGCLSEMRSLKVDSQMIVSLQTILHSGFPRPPLKEYLSYFQLSLKIPLNQ
ncbi:hypothetical protein S245_008833 [Arachis hypogaea]